MASETFAALTTALSQIYSRRLANQINNRSDALHYIPVVVGDDSGKNVAWTAKFGGTKTSTVFAEGADVGAGEYDKYIKRPATLDYGNYRCPARVTDLAVILAAAAEGSADELRTLVDSEVNDSVEQLISDIGSDLYVGDGDSGGNPSIVGLDGGATDATGIYAGIDRTTYPEWAGNVLANGGVARPLTDDLMRQAEQQVFNSSGGVAPNLILTTSGVHRKYAGLFGSIMRVQTAGQAPTQLAGGTMDLFWNNAKIVRDAKCPTGQLYMVNTADVELVVPRIIATTALPQAAPMVMRMGSDGTRQLSIPVIIEPLAKDGNALKYNVFSYIQLRVRYPNRTVRIEDISES